MFSVQHLTAFLNLLNTQPHPPFFTPFQHITVISLPLYKTSSPNPFLYTTPHRPFLTSIQHLTAHSLPLYSTSPPVPCLYTTPTACLEAWQPTPYPTTTHSFLTSVRHPFLTPLQHLISHPVPPIQHLTASSLPLSAPPGLSWSAGQRTDD